MTTTSKLQLQEVREALLRLHKALVETERVGYEQTMGAITSPNHFLKLLTTDPWFAWLHPLSQLIVAMDEALDTRKPRPPADLEALIARVRPLLTPAETGDGFPRNYFDALQRDPDVVLAHAAVTKLLGKKAPRPEPN